MSENKDCFYCSDCGYGLKMLEVTQENQTNRTFKVSPCRGCRRKSAEEQFKNGWNSALSYHFSKNIKEK